MGKLVDITDLAMNAINLGALVLANKQDKKERRNQAYVATGMTVLAAVISVVNTGLIVHNIKKHSEGVKIYDISRADGKSKNNRDGSGRNRITL